MLHVEFLSCDQATLWTVLSIRLSIRLSLCHTFTMFLSSCYHEISKVITIDKSDDHADGQDQSSKVKVTEVKTNCVPIWVWFHTITPVLIHGWLQNDVQILKWHRRGALLFFLGHPSYFKVTMSKILMIWLQFEPFRMATPIWIHGWL